MIKLKDILKESAPGFENRQFGDPLPTLRDIAKKYQEKNGEIKEELIAEKKELGGAMINTIDKISLSLIIRYLKFSTCSGITCN